MSRQDRYCERCKHYHTRGSGAYERCFGWRDDEISLTYRAAARTSGSPQRTSFGSFPVLRSNQKRNTAFLRALDSSTNTVVDVLLDPDYPYKKAAEALLTGRLLHLRFRHSLCEVLNAAAKAFDPSTYEKMPAREVSDTLVQLGVWDWAAKAITSTVIKTAKAAALAGGDPTAHIRLTLRGLIFLACPNLDRCPARNAVAKALVGPNVANSLKAAAEQAAQA